MPKKKRWHAMAEKGDPKVLGVVVLVLRHLTGMKQNEFGRAAGVAQGNVSRCEKGRWAPSDESLRRMAAVARVPWFLVVLLRSFLTAFFSLLDRATLPEIAKIAEDVLAIERATVDSTRLAVTPYLIAEALAEFQGPSP